jgi:predicted amidohydrolase
MEAGIVLDMRGKTSPGLIDLHCHASFGFAALKSRRMRRAEYRRHPPPRAGSAGAANFEAFRRLQCPAGPTQVTLFPEPGQGRSDRHPGNLHLRDIDIELSMRVVEANRAIIKGSGQGHPASGRRAGDKGIEMAKSWLKT